MNRSGFLRNAIVATGGLIAAPAFGFSRNHASTNILPPEKVKEFVAAGHNNLQKVKELLLEFPTLIYATHEGKDGDFETAIEGAGHVGDKEISNFLIKQGARTNMFVLTMLGKTNIVKPFLEAFPEYIFARGPHGLTLLHHAQRGKEDAAELLEYLQSKGLKETKVPL